MSTNLWTTPLAGTAVQTCNARDLHQFLGVGKVFAAWIQERIERYGFEQGKNYEVFSDSGNNPQGRRPTKEYAITIDTAKELAGAAVQTCNARDLWQFVESKRQFADWIKSRIDQYGFLEDEDYFVHKSVNNPAGGRPTLDYHLTIEMAKELAMVENNEKGRQVRRYFIECERRAKAASTARISRSTNLWTVAPRSSTTT